MANIREISSNCGAQFAHNLWGGSHLDRPHIAFLKSWDKKIYKRPIVIFTDDEYHGNGNAIWRFLNDNKLGNCTRTETLNGNHGKTVRVFVWNVDVYGVQGKISKILSDDKAKKPKRTRRW